MFKTLMLKLGIKGRGRKGACQRRERRLRFEAMEQRQMMSASPSLLLPTMGPAPRMGAATVTAPVATPAPSPAPCTRVDTHLQREMISITPSSPLLPHVDLAVVAIGRYYGPLKAPSNLKVANVHTYVTNGVTGHAVHLVWQDNSNNEQYFHIKRRWAYLAPDGHGGTKEVWSTWQDAPPGHANENCTSYDAYVNISNAVKYQFQVAAVNQDGVNNPQTSDHPKYHSSWAYSPVLIRTW